MLASDGEKAKSRNVYANQRPSGVRRMCWVVVLLPEAMGEHELT